jgi:hypothetical protein
MRQKGAGAQFGSRVCTNLNREESGRLLIMGGVFSLFCFCVAGDQTQGLVYVGEVPATEPYL